MSDATTAARGRIDQALAALERKVLELKARSAPAPSAEDDLFAARPDSRTAARVAELEAAGREASDALARAAEAVREIMDRAD